MAKIKTEKVTKNKVQMLNVLDIIKPIETGMNSPTDNEKSKKKIVKGL